VSRIEWDVNLGQSRARTIHPFIPALAPCTGHQSLCFRCLHNTIPNSWIFPAALQRRGRGKRRGEGEERERRGEGEESKEKSREKSREKRAILGS